MTPQEPIVASCVCGDASCALYGLCHCGCEATTSIAAETKIARGCVRGKPRKFIRGHQGIGFRPMRYDAIPFKIKGIYCRLIPLTQGVHAIVWASDYEWLTTWRWQLWKGQHGNWYAVRSEPRAEGHKLILMHRQIVDLDSSDQEKIDHISGIGIDNRRDNLRVTDTFGNNRNAKRNNVNSTGFKGVQSYFNRFRAIITVDGNHIYLGSRTTAEEAHELYKEAAVRYFGEFARFE